LNQYEAMFLFDPTFGGSFENCEAEIRRLMERAEAEIVFCRAWDERRLAYKVKGRKRGVYVLVYFKAAPGKIAPLERDAQLSENILRMLVLRADGVTPEAMEKALASRAEERSGEQDKSRDAWDRKASDVEPARRAPGARKRAAEVEPAGEAAGHGENDAASPVSAETDGIAADVEESKVADQRAP